MDLLSSPPHGRYYMPSSPPPEPSGVQCWPTNLWEKFEDKRIKLSKCILSATRRFHYKNFLMALDVPCLDGVSRQKWANLKSYCLAHFELQENQVYRQAEEHKGVLYKARYVACYNDAFDMICWIQRGIGY